MHLEGVVLARCTHRVDGDGDAAGGCARGPLTKSYVTGPREN